MATYGGNVFWLAGPSKLFGALGSSGTVKGQLSVLAQNICSSAKLGSCDEAISAKSSGFFGMFRSIGTDMLQIR